MIWKKHKGGAQINTHGWMLSYADMATILLALFIVLSTLGKDQTGVKLSKGMESYREAADTFGLSGFFSSSNKPVKQQVPSVGYGTQALDSPAEESPNGRSIDSEQEHLQQFLGEMDRTFRVQKMPRVSGQATVDFYDRFTLRPPYFTAKHQAPLTQLLSVLRKPNYRVTLIVWAATPSDTAWVRAGQQAHVIGEEVATLVDLDAAARSRLTVVAQPWRYPNFQRPVMSLVITKTAQP